MVRLGTGNPERVLGIGGSSVPCGRSTVRGGISLPSAFDAYAAPGYIECQWEAAPSSARQPTTAPRSQSTRCTAHQRPAIASGKSVSPIEKTKPYRKSAGPTAA
jgi:hypothetical protein